MRQGERPRAVEGLVVSPLFERRGAPTTWIFGHPELDRYLTVPDAALQPVRRAAELMDGTRTAEEIRGCVRAEIAKELDVGDLTGRLRGAGLLYTPKGSVAARSSHIERLSLTLFTLPMGEVAAWTRRHAPWASAAWFAGLTLAVVASLAILAGVPEPANPWLRAPSPALLVVGMLASVLLHELSHGLAALREGLTPRSLSGSLYLGYLPLFYLRIPGIYTLLPAARIRVWSAGCMLNGTLVLVGLACSRLLSPGSAAGSWWHAIALWNLAVLQLNLLPFLPTDGYFLLSTLLREHNLRARAWRTAVGWLRGGSAGGGRVQLGMALYLVMVIAMLGKTLVAATVWFRSMTADWGPLQPLGFLGPVLFIAFTMLWRSLFVTGLNAFRPGLLRHSRGMATPPPG
ncbi:MAG TPA: hypothetical protein VHG28_23785 [Longimicrobiaceae bacterium]|nr:hypothetical protein [Longimicrobiaceae bacterium]